MARDLKVWVVRAGEGGYLFEDFKSKSIVAIGWDKVGDIIGKSWSEINELMKKAYPEYSQGRINISAGQLYRFMHDFQQDDFVITYSPEKRVYLIGRIQGDCEWDPKEEYKHVRHVKWVKEIPRDNLSVTTKNTLGAILTIFEVWGDAKNELLGIIRGEKPSISEKQIVEVELDTLKEDMEARSWEFIKDRLSKLDWNQMQRLVAGILRSMGYKTIISPEGPDRGKDIVASPDGLGLEEPRIIVQVKHRQGQTNNKELGSFANILRTNGSKGLYVSTGGFTKDARYEAERSTNQITLIDFELLVQLVIDNCDKFDSETKELIPLKKIYWPE